MRTKIILEAEVKSAVACNVYLFDVIDTPDEVAKDQLEVLTRMFIDLKRELDATLREEVRTK